MGLANAALWGLVEIQQGVTALIDIGFRCSTITILCDGQIALNRVVTTGGDAISAQLADEMNATYRVAEAIKVSLPDRAQDKLQQAVKGLCDEIRIAIDFFEHTYERPVSHAWVSGAAASSPCMLHTLQSQLRLLCQPISLSETLSLSLPTNQVANLEAHGPQLASALGAAAARLESSGIHLNFLAEKEDVVTARRRDPVLWAKRFSGVAFGAVALWLIILAIQLGLQNYRNSRLNVRLESHSRVLMNFENSKKEYSKAEKTLKDISKRAHERFLWTGPLNALQTTIVDGITVARVQMDERLTFSPNTRRTNLLGVVFGKPPYSQSQIVLSISAKDYGNPPAAERFVRAIREQAWFKANLRETDPILVRERSQEQVDPLDPAKTFRLTRIECHFKPVISYDE